MRIVGSNALASSRHVAHCSACFWNERMQAQWPYCRQSVCAWDFCRLNALPKKWHRKLELSHVSHWSMFVVSSGRIFNQVTGVYGAWFRRYKIFGRESGLPLCPAFNHFFIQHIHFCRESPPRHGLWMSTSVSEDLYPNQRPLFPCPRCTPTVLWTSPCTVSSLGLRLYQCFNPSLPTFWAFSLTINNK